MPSLDLDWALLQKDLLLVVLAFALTFPIGGERGRGSRSVGFRTLPVVGMAACGFALIIVSEGAQTGGRPASCRGSSRASASLAEALS